MPGVHHKHRGTAPVNAVYIGRPTVWGNPFPIGNGAKNNREAVIRKHREWVLSQPKYLARIKRELRGKDLVCFCKPKACHGDTLLEIANGE